MTVANESNLGRVDKIVQFLGLIEKSARSNKATPEELQNLLQPAISAIEALCIGAGTETPQNASQSLQEAEGTPDAEDEGQATTLSDSASIQAQGQSQVSYLDIRDAARTAPLPHLTYAMAVYLDRIDEQLHGGTALPQSNKER